MTFSNLSTFPTVQTTNWILLPAGHGLRINKTNDRGAPAHSMFSSSEWMHGIYQRRPRLAEHSGQILRGTRYSLSFLRFYAFYSNIRRRYWVTVWSNPRRRQLQTYCFGEGRHTAKRSRTMAICYVRQDKANCHLGFRVSMSPQIAHLPLTIHIGFQFISLYLIFYLCCMRKFKLLHHGNPTQVMGMMCSSYMKRNPSMSYLLLTIWFPQ